MSFFLRLFRAVFVFTRGIVSPLHLLQLQRLRRPSKTGYRPSSRFTRFVSACETLVGLRSRRLRLRDFFVRMWLLNALRRRNEPDPLLRKRFAADRFVFIFGIFSQLLFGAAPTPAAAP
jgi:hypothetical protein